MSHKPCIKCGSRKSTRWSKDVCGKCMDEICKSLDYVDQDVARMFYEPYSQMGWFLNEANKARPIVY